MTLRAIVHLLLHIAVPAGVAVGAAREKWLKPFLLMMATMVVDLDHLLAVPLYDPNRCSIGFHPLHQPVPIALYGLLVLIPQTRWIGTGLVIHMLLDGLDCALM